MCLPKTPKRQRVDSLSGSVTDSTKFSLLRVKYSADANNNSSVYYYRASITSTADLQQLLN